MKARHFARKELLVKLFSSYFSSDLGNCLPASMGTTISMALALIERDESFQFSEALICVLQYIEENGKILSMPNLLLLNVTSENARHFAMLTLEVTLMFVAFP
jgi:hypothetical protein